MQTRINQQTVKAQKRKKSDAIQIICCFSNELLSPYDPEKVSYSYQGKEIIGFRYEYFFKMTQQGRNYFPKLTKTKPKGFDIIAYLNKTVNIINDEKKRDAKRKKNTAKKIISFLNKTGLDKYVGGTDEFIKFGLRQTPIVEPKVIVKKFRETKK